MKPTSKEWARLREARKAQQHLVRAQKTVDEALAERDELIDELLDEGIKQTQIAAAMELSRERISKITASLRSRVA